MIYDGLSYLKEYRTLEHKKGVKKEEFLSGMGREERLHPVVTAVIYYGEKAWDGPRSLADMMTDMSEEIAAAFCNYGMHLIQTRESEAYAFQNRDVKLVFGACREIFRGDYEKLEQIYGNESIDRELASVIAAITDTPDIADMFREKEGEITMCEAMERLKEECRTEGRTAGRIEGRGEGEKQKASEIIVRMLKKGYSEAQIMEITGVSREEVDAAQAVR